MNDEVIKKETKLQNVCLRPSKELAGCRGEYKDFRTSGWEFNELYWCMYPAYTEKAHRKNYIKILLR